MTQDILWLNSFFSYFFALGDYLKVFFALGLTGLLFLGFVKFFVRDSS
jgi:hypothetical protein